MAPFVVLMLFKAFLIILPGKKGVVLKLASVPSHKMITGSRNCPFFVVLR